MHVERQWPRPPFGTETLFDRRVGIHGFGSIARKLVTLLRPFRAKVSAFSDGVPDRIFENCEVAQAASLDELFRESEILVELEALTPVTVGQVDERRLRLLRPGATFVNVGRGGLVDEPALTRIAEEGQLRVALDVYAVEPLPASSPLRGKPNVTLFPHCGGPVDAGYTRCGDFALANLERYLRHEPLQAVVDLEVFDRST